MSDTGGHVSGSLGLLLVMLGLGAVEFLRIDGIQIALSVVGFLWIARGLWRGGIRQSRMRFFSATALILLLFAMYNLNPTHSWKAGMGALPVDHIGFLPGGAFPEGAVRSTFFVALALSALGLTQELERKEITILGTVVLTGAVIASLAVLGQRLAPRRFPVFDVTGFFAYENHFAAFANLILPVALAWGARFKFHAFLKGKVSSPSGLCYWGAVLLIAAVWFSRSRAGLFIAALMVVGFICNQIYLRRRYPFIARPLSRRMKIGVGLGCVVPAVGLLGLRISNQGNFDWIGEGLIFRFRILTDTLSMWRSHLWWGTGPGSFAAVFPYYQSLPVEEWFFSHAHCEGAEFLAEYGVLGGGLFLAGTALILFSAPVHSSRDPETPSFRELEGVAFVLSLAGISLHSLIDFPFRHPLNALLTVVWIGILTGLCRNALSSNGKTKPNE